MSVKKLDVKIKKLNDRAIIPRYQTDGSAGFDFHAIFAEDDLITKDFSTKENVIRIAPGEQRLIHTGLAFSLPEGYELQIRPRSGLALKKGITITNTPGTLDSSYRGECCVILRNLGEETFDILEGDRIAQGVINEITQAEFDVVDNLDETERGDGGFGSTGV